MGLDMYIDKCRTPISINGKRDYYEREEVCYWRKFWDLLREGLPFEYGDTEYGHDIALSKEDVEQILDYVAHNKDYFGGFSSVQDVAALLNEYDYLIDEGYVIVFHADW